jgi:hypothetical protein
MARRSLLPGVSMPRSGFTLLAWVVCLLLASHVPPAISTPLVAATTSVAIPTEIGKLGGAISSVAVRGTLAVAGDLQGILLIDIMDPSRPFLISSLDLGGEAKDLALAGNLVYVANFQGSLQIVDIANVFAPRLRGNLPIDGGPSGIDVANGRAAIAAFNGGLQIVDVSNPDAPALVGVAPLGNVNEPGDWIRGSVQDVRIAGDLVYIASSGALEIFDAGNPARMKRLSFRDMVAENLGGTWALDVVDNRVYIAAGPSGLVMLDVSLPTAPRVIATLDMPGYIIGVQISGERAYLAEREGGLQLVDLSIPDQPQRLGRIDMPGSTVRLTVASNQVYLADSGGGMTIVDVGGDNPRLLGYYGVAGNSSEIVVVGNRAYVGSFEGLVIADISTPARPRVLGALGFPGFVYDIAVAGDMVYVGSDLRGQEEFNYDDAEVWLVNVHDPTAPRIVSSLHFPNDGVGDLAIFGSTLYAAMHRQGLQLIDVAKPEEPVRLGTPAGVTSSYIDGLVTSELRAYLGSGEVLDVSDPLSPTLLGTLSLSNTSIHDADGTTAYMVERLRFRTTDPSTSPFSSWQYSTTLKIVDASDLSASRVLGNYRSNAEIVDVRVVGSSAYVLTRAGIDLVDVRDPSSPTLVAALNPNVVPGTILLTDDLIFSGGYRQGLAIYERQRRFAPQWASLTKEAVLVSADGTVRLSFDDQALGERSVVAQIERLAPSMALGHERAVVRSFLIEARDHTGAAIEQTSGKYTLTIDASTPQLAAQLGQGIAYWDGARWVDLPRCWSCPVQSGQIAVQTDRFGELALVADATVDPSPTPVTPVPTDPPSSQPRSRLYLPMLQR